MNRRGKRERTSGNQATEKKEREPATVGEEGERRSAAERIERGKEEEELSEVEKGVVEEEEEEEMVENEARRGRRYRASRRCPHTYRRFLNHHLSISRH